MFFEVNLSDYVKYLDSIDKQDILTKTFNRFEVDIRPQKIFYMGIYLNQFGTVHYKYFS